MKKTYIIKQKFALDIVFKIVMVLLGKLRFWGMATCTAIKRIQTEMHIQPCRKMYLKNQGTPNTSWAL